MAEYLKKPPGGGTAAQDVVRVVSEMLSSIERDGEAAVRKYSEQLDGWNPPSFVVSDSEIRAASAQVDGNLKEHIDLAQQQVRAFALEQRKTISELEFEAGPGIVLGHKIIPVDTVGAYVPGGQFTLLASSFMTILVAKAAGVSNVVACAPSYQKRGIHPTMVHAMHTSGADQLLSIGGVQALASMAFGLFDMPPASMIVGAGNAYVAEAKRQLFGRVGIDLLAGPTEILVLADGTADPELVAVDLLGQAEHGPTSPAWLVTTSPDLGAEVLRIVDRLLATTWPTKESAGPAWRDHGMVLVASDDDEAIAISNEMAPEHLEVQVSESLVDHYFSKLKNYGSLFLGSEATVAYGDKGIGTNHVLPTGRAARYTGGLWVGKFLKTVTYQRVTSAGTRFIAPTIAAISTEERMLGHALTADVRLARAQLTKP